MTGDAGGLTDTATVWINAPTRNVAPFIDIIATQHGTEDEAVSFTLPTGVASDANDDDLDVTATRRGGSALPKLANLRRGDPDLRRHAAGRTSAAPSR